VYVKTSGKLLPLVGYAMHSQTFKNAFVPCEAFKEDCGLKSLCGVCSELLIIRREGMGWKRSLLRAIPR
jgi:hypothetical protein